MFVMTIRFFALNLVFAGFIALSQPVLAASIPPPIASTPCDSLYYESMSAKAWMEAQREITQNQNIILKPDSIMEYTCFDMFLKELSQHATNMLSETGAFGGPNSSSSMDNALEQLVGVSLRAYGSSNFGQGTLRTYDLLGGHSAGSFIAHTFGSISGGAYTCNIMENVWQAAKCINFMSHLTIDPTGSGTPTDGFFTFQEYADVTDVDNLLDKRHRPTACTPPKTTWTANLTTANILPPWSTDPINTYLVHMSPPTCAGSPCVCDSARIPTGLKINRTGSEPPAEYYDHACLQPGCRYNPPGGKINGTVRPEGCYTRF